MGVLLPKMLNLCEDSETSIFIDSVSMACVPIGLTNGNKSDIHN